MLSEIYTKIRYLLKGTNYNLDYICVIQDVENVYQLVYPYRKLSEADFEMLHDYLDTFCVEKEYCDIIRSCVKLLIDKHDLPENQTVYELLDDYCCDL